MYWNQNLAMMSAQPMIGVGGMFNNIFMYHGNPIGLQTRLQQIHPGQGTNFKQATINCTGIQTKQYDMCCMICTLIWGAILIFPLFFLCCDWWKKLVYPNFNVPQSTYQSLQKLVMLPSLQNLSLVVVDNHFNKQKAQILYNILSESHLKGFTFMNGAMNFGVQGKQYDDFEENMRPIKKLPIMSEIKWYTKLVL